MTRLFNCPAEGCEYGPKPLTSLAGHWSAKRDEPHEGGGHIAVEKAMAEGPVGEVAEEDTLGAHEDPQHVQKPDAEEMEGVTFPEAEEPAGPVVTDDDPDDDADDDGPTCEDCGGELDAAEDFPGFYQCEDCGEWWEKVEETGGDSDG